MRRVLVRLGGILVLAAIAVWLYCVLDAATADRERVRALPKGLWVVVVIVTFIAGALAWLLVGRPRGPERAPRLGSSRRTSWPARPASHPSSSHPSAGAFRRPGDVAPDDDPEFLARLERDAARDHEKLLGSWEADLRRREEELRRRETDPDEEPGDAAELCVWRELSRSTGGIMVPVVTLAGCPPCSCC